MAVIKAMEPGEPPVIRGKVKEALVFLWRYGESIFQGEIPPSKFPYQTNNLDAWFKSAYIAIGAPMRPMLAYPLLGDQYELKVNDGEGPKIGRGSNENEFSYELSIDGVRTWRLLIRIYTVSHQQAHAEKLAAGHKPRPRVSWKGKTYLDVSKGKIFQWNDQLGDHMLWDPEEYYTEYPDHRGNILVKQAGLKAGAGGVDG